MLEWFASLDHVVQAVLATLFTWGVTAMGAALVYFFRGASRPLLDGMLGFSAGVMIAASFWSLLEPAIVISEKLNMIKWLPPLVGFLTGAAVLWLLDRILPHLHLGLPTERAEGISTTWHRSVLLVLAITLHNFPEGLAVGVAFGALSFPDYSGSLTDAMLLALGIGIQNFPEGFAISMPLRREGFPKHKAFFYGQLSAVVEPIGAFLGASAVMAMEQLLPYALSFAAGAMIFVVVEELIPESQQNHNTDNATIGAILGFALMMTLDVAFG
jgi:ZIP family zinc transporter